MPDSESPGDEGRRGLLWRWKWAVIVPTLLAIGLCLAVALSDKVTALLVPSAPGTPVILGSKAEEQPESIYESRATIELQDNRPLGYQEGAAKPGQDAILMRLILEAREDDISRFIPIFRARALNWSAVREIVLSRKVPFEREIDPDDRQQLERIYRFITKGIRVTPLGSKHLTVAFRSANPEVNAALVNEVVKKFVEEDRKDAQERAVTALKFYRDKQASARTQLAEIDARLREFAQAQPWLGDSLSELNKEYKEVEDEELRVRRQVAGVEAGLTEFRKELAKERPEIAVMVRAEPPPEVRAARQKAMRLKAQFENVDATHTRAHQKWQEAKAALDAALAKLDEIDKGEAEEVEETRPNPKYAALQEQVAALEKELEKLNWQKLEANKQVSLLYIRLRKAPELLAERRGLEEQRATAFSTFQEYSNGARAAEKEMMRLLTEAYSSRFKVLEYARATYLPPEEDAPEAKPPGASGTGTEGAPTGANQTASEAQGDPVADIQSKAISWAVGIGIGAFPTLLLILATALLGRRALGRPDVPPKGNALLALLVGAICLSVPAAAIVGAVALSRGHRPTPKPDNGPVHKGVVAPPAVDELLPRTSLPAQKPVEEPVAPKSVTEFHKGNISFAQLDGEGMLTSITHTFRELLPEGAKVFTVVRDDDTHGKILVYRLRNVGTGETYEFSDVEVSKVDPGWALTEDGWTKVRGELQARMNLRLGRPAVSGD